MTDRYAVMGNPIAQSKSPVIHAAFAQQTGQELMYDKQLVPEGAFAEHAQAFFAAGGKGLNVTVPFKLDAFALAQVLSDRARLAGSVNTLWVDEAGQVAGDNTDGIGIVRDLVNNHRVSIKGKRLLLLGAGGAVRGVIGPLLEQGPEQLIVANRAAAKAEHLADLYSMPDVIIGSGFSTLGKTTFDLIINGTAASLSGDVPAIPDTVMAGAPVCYDMMYAATATSFNTWAAARGARETIDGLGMLVEQAAESFYIWRGVRPDCTPVIDQLRRELSESAR